MPRICPKRKCKGKSYHVRNNHINSTATPAITLYVILVLRVNGKMAVDAPILSDVPIMNADLMPHVFFFAPI